MMLCKIYSYMKKVIPVLIFFMGTSLYSETLYSVVKTNNEVITGYILEDNPGESIVIEIPEDNSIVVIPYSEFLLIKPVETELEKDVEKEEPSVPKATEEVDEVNIEEEYEHEQSYTSDDLSLKLANLDLFSLNSLTFDSNTLNNTEAEIRIDAFNENKKEEVLKYALLNIVPGLGSIVQGDYYSAAYTISSVLGSVVYNLNGGFGTDYYFIINLNGALAYATSFIAPYRFNNSYNELLKEKLQLE